MAWPEVEMRSFLTERKDRFKPAEANALGLKRLEKIDFRGNMFVSDPKPTKTNMILIKKGDLVISGINAEKGALGIYDGNEDILATIHYSSYHYDKTKINIQYLRWFLKSLRFKQLLMEQAGGGIKTEIKPKKLLPLKLKLPDLITQEQIAIKLKSVANDFNQLTWINIENKDLTSQLRQSILQLAIQGKLVPQDPADEPASVLLQKIETERNRLIKEGKIRKQKPLPLIEPDEIPYKLPDSWKWVRLKDILEIDRDITYGIVKLGPQPKDKAVETLRCSNVLYRKISNKNIRRVSCHISNKYQRTILRGSELLMNIRGTLGGCAIVPSELRGCNIAREVAMIPLHKMINNRYLLDVISSPLIQINTTENLRGIAYKGLNLSILRMFYIPLPPLAEQKHIVAKVDKLMALCDQLEQKLTQAKSDGDKLIASVIHHLLSRSPRMVRATTPYKDDAAVICLLLAEMEKLHRPTTEFFIQKHIFVTKHHLHLPLNSLFVRKAAGPWSHELKRKAIFAAIKMNWLRWEKNRLVPGSAFENALSHASMVLGEEAVRIAELVNDLRKFHTNGLERWTTVLKVVEDLKEAQQPITRSNIQHEIDNWPDKSLKEIFTEESINHTINKMIKYKWLSTSAGQ